MNETDLEIELDLAESDEGTYGTFFVGDSEFALPTSQIREVVPYPNSVTPVPLSKDTVRGIFSLRGELIPIVDLAALLCMKSSVAVSASRVAVLEHGTTTIGVALDKTGEVLRTEAGDFCGMRHADDTGRGVISGMIQRPKEGRVIQTLDPALLGLESGVPDCERKDRAQVAQRTYSKAIVFRVGDTELALKIEDVLEIQGELDVDRSLEYFEHCSGVTVLREQSYPVLDMREALSSSTSEDAAFHVFVHCGATSVGLAVDGLIETYEFADDQLQEIPGLMGSAIAQICGHVIAAAPERNILMLDVSKLYRHFSVGEAGAVLGQVGLAQADQAVAEDEEVAFFSFRVGELVMCVSLDSVLEVQQLSDDIVTVGTSEGGGLLNLRGSVVPLIASRRLFNIQSSPEEHAGVGLILEADGERFGLVVDGIEDIKRVRSSTIARNEAFASSQGSVSEFMDSAVIAEAANGDLQSLLVLDVNALTRDRRTREITGAGLAPSAEGEGADELG